MSVANPPPPPHAFATATGGPTTTISHTRNNHTATRQQPQPQQQGQTDPPATGAGSTIPQDNTNVEVPTTSTVTATSSNSNKRSFACLYTKHKTRKRKVYHDGKLVVTRSSGTATLHAISEEILTTSTLSTVLDTCVLSPAQCQAIWGLSSSSSSLIPLDTEQHFIQIEGPWVVRPPPSTNNHVSQPLKKPKRLSTTNNRKFQRPKRFVPNAESMLPKQPRYLQRPRPLQPGEFLQKNYPQHVAAAVAPQQVQQQQSHQHGRPQNVPPLQRGSWSGSQGGLVSNGEPLTQFYGHEEEEEEEHNPQGDLATTSTPQPFAFAQTEYSSIDDEGRGESAFSDGHPSTNEIMPRPFSLQQPTTGRENGPNANNEDSLAPQSFSRNQTSVNGEGGGPSVSSNQGVMPPQPFSWGQSWPEEEMDDDPPAVPHSSARQDGNNTLLSRPFSLENPLPKPFVLGQPKQTGNSRVEGTTSHCAAEPSDRPTTAQPEQVPPPPKAGTQRTPEELLAVFFGSSSEAETEKAATPTFVLPPVDDSSSSSDEGE